MNEEPTAEPDHSAAFAALADPTRIEILSALAVDPGEPASFSTLRERVGTTDSGRFNYHLGKLVGRFVSKTDEGYQLTTAGFQIYGAILAGTYSGSAEFEPVEVDEPCPACEHVLEARYEEEQLRIVCPDCGRVKISFAFPPGAIEDRSPEELLDALDQRLRATLPLAQGGTCPLCWGRTEKHLAMVDFPGHDEKHPTVVISCSRCGDQLRASPGALLLNEPAVVAAYHDQGIDLREQPLWSLPWLREQALETLSTDPLRVRVGVAVGERTLHATIDPDGTVAAIEPAED